MINITKEAIKKMDHLHRLTLINSITGYKPANLIGTANSQGKTNLAIISSIVHLGSDPALIGFMMRPMVSERHTMENILETKFYTINHLHRDIAERGHFTSADFDRDTSEFERCGLTPWFLDGFSAPFVKESRIGIGMSFAEKIDIKLNGVILVMGYVEHIYMEDHYLNDDQSIDLHKAGTICISGLDRYNDVHEFAQYPYATPANTPKF
ncbi:MAG: flavin reductase [Saprospiraceae bacterium]